MDIFFVISGYLITMIILHENQASTFSLVNFYERRARRILPALFLVMAVCIPFTWVWLIPDDMKDFSKSLIAVSLFASNFLFFRQTGYFDTAADLKPLLHTWSLAVEEQYYILFPLFIMSMWRFGRFWIILMLIGIAFISLAIAQWGAYHKPAFTFFLLPARVWELIIGALTAFYFTKKNKSFIRKSTAQFASIVGFLMILYSVFGFNKATPFPSLYALLPTIGAALIILFATPTTLVGWMLGCRVFVGVGVISYSLYLWHQPLFALARHRNLTEPSLTVFSVLVMCSLMLAYLSWRFVETPFRKSTVISRAKIFRFAVIGAIFIIFGLVGKLNNGFGQRFARVNVIKEDFIGHNLRKDCDQGYDGNGEEIKFCNLGNVKVEPHPTLLFLVIAMLAHFFLYLMK